MHIFVQKQTYFSNFCEESLIYFDSMILFEGSQDMKNRTGVGELVYIDPIGAILISIYIAVNWWRTGYGNTFITINLCDQ